MEREHARVLLATQTFPPAIGGTSVILYELLRHFPPEMLVAVHGLGDPPDKEWQHMHFPRYRVLVNNSIRNTFLSMDYWPGLYVRLLRRQIERLARQYKVERIYAHYPSAHFMIAAWQAAVKLRLPLTVYFDILWEECAQARLGRLYEHQIVQYADMRIAITEHAVGYLAQKHGVPFTLIPHTLDITRLPEEVPPAPANETPIVHFAGAIYPRMNQDSVQRLIAALETMQPQPRLDLCSPLQPPQELELGLPKSFIQPRFLSRDALIQAQRQADLLYLPLAFESDAPRMIEHNMPTKAMEYLVSGRPILVHAPGESYLADLARREGFALVVDQPDAQVLASALQRLLQDRPQQEELVANARAFARSRDSRLWSQQFMQMLAPDAAIETGNEYPAWGAFGQPSSGRSF